MTIGNLIYSRGKTFYVNPSHQCTNSCLFCIRNFKDGVYGYNLRLSRYPSSEELVNAVNDNLNDSFEEVAIVGFGEPLLNLGGTLAVVKSVKESLDIPVRINTNGHALLIHPYRNVPDELADAGLDKVQVSLNAQDAQTYVRLCRPSFGEAAYYSLLEFAKRCAQRMRVDLSVVAVPGVDIEECKTIAKRLGVGFRLRNYKGPPEVLKYIKRQLID